MNFRETRLKGAYVIEIEPFEDERGFFARTWCKKEFESAGLDAGVAQCSTSFNGKAGTLRGMHFKAAPHDEVKLVRCTRGAVYDVIIDLRPGSMTYMQWVAETLTGENHRMIYVPRGFAHGFKTLEDDSEVLYQISEFYTPEGEMGLRWNDPKIAIEWPETGRLIISERDANWPGYGPRG